MTFCKYLTSVIFIFCLFHTVWPSCVFQDEKYDLSPLDLPGGWRIAYKTYENISLQYVIDVCGSVNSSTPETKGCENSSVCQISGNTSTNFGDSISSNKALSISSHTQTGFTIYLVTRSICNNRGNYRSSINFVCGQNLGVPQIVLRSDCQVNIFWKTYAACLSKPKTKQVPCYAIDEQGESRDLSHLVKPEGGYFVNTPDPAIDFVINVCSDIVPDNSTRSCPVGSSACLIDGNNGVEFGKVESGLQYTREGLLLTYKTPPADFTYPGHSCPLDPKTTILFKCPQRGHSQPPKVISDANCQYEIVWETEYACPQSSLKSNLKACQFNTDKHGVEIDLSPLKQNKKNNTTFYLVDSTSSNTTSFAISVCGGLGNFNCGSNNQWGSKSVCMINKTSKSDFRVVGSTVGSNFMYADDEVILTYPKGENCDSGLEHSTEINFVCDPLAGDGEPKHLFSDHCIHMFEWATKHACLQHLLDTPCSVTYDKKKFNLQKLLLVEGQSWEAVDRRKVKFVASELYINVCGQVSHLGNLTGCGEGSSACISHKDGSFLNLGNFTTPPVFDPVSNSVKLEYTGGSPCAGGQFWRSTIEFVCRPGQINSEPVLQRVDEIKCHYEFEWQTAEACPEGLVQGSDCKVYDANMDVNFDLSPLKSKVYEVDSGHYKFYLGVCEAIKDSPCSKSPNSSENVGVCQEDVDHQTAWKTGEPSSNLSYNDGVVNLTYLSGDHYSDANKTARMTIMIFICNYTAGHGSPELAEEVNFAYVFHWYTDLVCPSLASTSMECLARDPGSHLIYDLSGLALSGSNWMTIVGEDDKELRIYLNVCRSLTLNSLCDPNAAACVTEMENGVEKAFISNIGKATGPPVLEGPGHLSLTYTSGNPCIAYGQNRTYSAIIHFICSDQQAKKGPIFLNKVGNCEYAFLWSTSAACPTGNLEVIDSCQLTDPETGFTFDLTPLQLKKEPYSVDTSLGTYQLNVCGRIFEGCTTPDGKRNPQNVSVCEVDGEGNNRGAIATADSYTLSYSVGQDLTLTYKPNASVADSVEVKFPCYEGDVDYKPTLVEHQDRRYVFEMKTRLTCIPKHVECDVVDDMGNEYDLSPLRFHSGNWEVSDHRPENRHVRYHLNFCGPLNKVDLYKCPGGSSSACQTSTLLKDSSGHDLGWFLRPPVANGNGTLTLQYTNGSFCLGGFQRTTTISLFCAKEMGSLIFIGETPECEYVFSMETPAACPIRSTHGNSCMVKDPVYGYMFDLNPLKSKNNNYNLTVGEYEYLFNVCDKLNSVDGVCSDSSVCQTKPGDKKFSKSLGLPNANPVYRKGLITLEYEAGSGNCHGKYNRSTILAFTCHHGREAKDGPMFVSEAEDCSYLFEWPTVHACPPFDVMDCSVTDESGTYYDLSPLSLPDDNYYLKNPYSTSAIFVVNLCRSIVHVPTSLCPYTAASCLIGNTTIPLNLGKVGNAPYVEDDKIKIKYTSGDPCSVEGVTTSRFWESVIEFNCDPHKIVSEPEFVGKDDCTYYFDWHTVYACAEKPAESHGDCTVADPVTGHMFNISSLGSNGMVKTQVGPHNYYFNICSNDSSSPCGKGTGICQEEMVGEKRFWKAGRPNRNLTISGTSLFLNFSNGDSCHNGHYNRNAIVEFTCGHGIGEPKFLYESYDCTYYFHWKTELACQSKIHCSVENGTELYDLSSLSATFHTAGSSVLNEGAAYYVSVCGSLPGFIGGAFCPPESGICRVSQVESSGTFTQSLGQMLHSPMIDFQGFITMLYTNGSVCVKKPTEQNRARIIFKCDSKVGMGEPVLIDIPEECFFLFEWRSSLVCPKEPEEDIVAISTCDYTDLGRGIHFDLGPLRKSHEAYVVDDDKSGNHFLVKVCSFFEPEHHPENCKKAGVCSIETGVSHNYGQAESQKFSYDGRRLRLSFSDGDDCPSGSKGKRTSEIFFVCDPSAGLGIPVLHKKYTCLVVFLWRTSLVCENMQQMCSFEVEGNHYDFNLLSSLSHNWNVMKDGTDYFINLCRGVQETEDTSGCSHTAAVCMVDKDSNHITLGTVQTMEVKPINATDLLLTFESSDKSACTNVGPNLTPVTRLFMRCGSGLGNPRLFSGPDSKCFYDFIWESSLACPEKAEQVMLEKGGIIEDEVFGFFLNITDILNRTFSTVGLTGDDIYVYEINLGGLPPNSTSSQCSRAAVCQRKPSANFSRDIGSFDTRTFILRESELHLTFVSTTKRCGKNESKNVTTIINMQCASSAGRGLVFMYESGDCDYVFNWETAAVCPNFHKQLPSNDTKDNHPIPNPYKEAATSSHTSLIITGLMIAVIVLLAVVFVAAKPERRAHVSHRFRTMFGRVNLPYFRYKRGDVLTELQSDF